MSTRIKLLVFSLVPKQSRRCSMKTVGITKKTVKARAVKAKTVKAKSQSNKPSEEPKQEAPEKETE